MQFKCVHILTGSGHEAIFESRILKKIPETIFKPLLLQIKNCLFSDQHTVNFHALLNSTCKMLMGGNRAC